MDSAKGESKYERLRKIGIGSYGVVFKCINRQTGQIVAIKRYSENDSDPVIRKIAMREVRMLRQLKHPNLINLIEVFRRKHRLHLVFDYCELTVLDVIEKYGNSCPLNLIKKITWQIVNGIDYCHQHNCIHRDIKPENILINQCGVVKLCDFGFARNFNANRLNVSSLITNKMKLGQQRNLASQVGGSEKENIDSSAMNDSQANKSNNRQAFTDYVATRWYRAPELLVGEIYYDVKIDIWAIGCVTAELIRGEPIWPGKTDFDQLCLIKSTLGPLTSRQTQTLLNRAIYDQFNTERLMNQQMRSAEALEKKLSLRVGQCAVEFVSDCLQMDPARRPSSHELLRHKYINSVKIPQLISKESSPLTVGASIDHQPFNSARQVAKGISLVPVPLRQRPFLNQVQHPPRANSQILMLAAQTAARPVAAISTPAKRPLLDAKQDGRQLLSKLQAPVNYGPFATNKTITSNQTVAYNQKLLQRKRQQQISVEKPTNLRRSSQATGASTFRHKFNSIKPKEAASNGVMHKSLLPISKTPSGHQLTDKVVTTGNLVTNKYKFDGDRNRLGSDQSSGSSSIRLDTAFRVGGITNNQQANAYLIQNELRNSTGNRSSMTCKPEAQTYESFKDKGLIEADCSRLSTDDLPDDSSSFSAQLASTTMKPNSISFLPPIQSKYNDYHRENEENENDASFDARANHSTGESRTFSQDDQDD